MGQTIAVRVPKAIVAQVLDYAKRLDSGKCGGEPAGVESLYSAVHDKLSQTHSHLADILSACEQGQTGYNALSLAKGLKALNGKS